MARTVWIHDNQLEKDIRYHPNRALHLVTSYPIRFSIVDYHDFTKGVNEMARLVEKAPVLYQRKLMLEDVEGLDLSVKDLEEKGGNGSTYFIMRVQLPDKSTGYINMGFAPIVEALRHVDTKKDLPADVRFVKQNNSWLME